LHSNYCWIIGSTCEFWVNPVDFAFQVRIVVPRGPQPLRQLKLRGRFYSNATVSALAADGTAHLLGVMTPFQVYDEVCTTCPIQLWNA
jgi:hypothetical protein